MTQAQQLHFFVGKGGAGKTSLSTAYALNLVERFPKEKHLLVSLEPAFALSDLVKKKLSPKPAKLAAGKGSGGLFGAELEPKALLEAFLKKHKAAFAAAAPKGAVLSIEDLQQLLGVGLAGLEELAVMFWLFEQLETKAFDRIVVDSLGTSHTLRQLDVPLALRRLIAIARSEKAGKKKELVASPLDELAGRLDQLMAFLKNSAACTFHIVSIAEPVPEAQTRLLFAGLRERGVHVSQIVLNMIEDGQGGPEFFGRRGLQAPHVRKLQQLDKAVPVHLLGRRELSPKGLEAIKKLSKEWASGKETKALEFAPSEGPPALVRAPSMPPIAAPPLPPTRLIFFVGQGGVGKSSCAAAAAVTLTEKEGPVLLISVDPAHSLSDVLQSRLTDTETQVKGTKGLYARELDVVTWFSNLRKRWKEKAERALGPEIKGQEVAVDRELLRNLLDAAPAGLEDLAGLCVLTDALVQERFKRIVVDPAPSGSGVRLVELPEMARGWLSQVHAIVSKYRGKGLGELADEIAAMQRHIKRFEDALATPVESRFVVVTRPEELAASRTERLVQYLQGKKLAVERVLVNRVLPKSSSPRWENRRKNELNATKLIEKRVGLPVTVAPALGRYPAGLRELKAFRTAWYALSAPVKIKAA